MSHQEPTVKITPVSRKIIRQEVRWSVLVSKITVIQEILRVVWDRFVACSLSKQVRYRRLSRRPSSTCYDREIINTGTGNGCDTDCDSVSLKISLLGDRQIGKTSFMVTLLFRNSFFIIYIN